MIVGRATDESHRILSTRIHAGGSEAEVSWTDYRRARATRGAASARRFAIASTWRPCSLYRLHGEELGASQLLGVPDGARRTRSSAT